MCLQFNIKKLKRKTEFKISKNIMAYVIIIIIYNFKKTRETYVIILYMYCFFFYKITCKDRHGKTHNTVEQFEAV